MSNYTRRRLFEYVLRHCLSKNPSKVIFGFVAALCEFFECGFFVFVQFVRNIPSRNGLEADQ